jgi:hypothetical protein
MDERTHQPLATIRFCSFARMRLREAQDDRWIAHRLTTATAL